ncbi:MAG: von Willebrand factor type A domain-containing protein [Bacteroidetes bacterium]|nr:von Willebrand factor type A domain-containing protein [Bacteroidota bacterium]
MKTACYILLLQLLGSPLFSQQYYIRGEVRDESGNLLQNVSLVLQSTGYLYHTGTFGSFGITTGKRFDSLTCSLEGYQKQTIAVDAEAYINIKLKLNTATANSIQRDRLSSITTDLTRETQKEWFTGDETYASIVENRFVNAKKYPSTGLSLDIDGASYSNIRRFLNFNTLVPPDAVRIEEMLNYFGKGYNEPENGDLFRVESKLTECPWNAGNQLLYVNVSAKKLNLDTLPPSNLVFLIDVSGSMDMPNRLPLLKMAFHLLVNNLRAKDTVSIVVYGGVVGVMLPPTGGAEKQKILEVIDSLAPGGATPGESGIRVAYSVAKRQYIRGGNNRIILATDGDFNVGLKTEAELDDLISQHRHLGIYLTCLGVGMGNYKDSKIHLLSQKGNGNFAYLDNFQEAEKVLMKEFTGTLYAVADDVYMNVSFNPDLVKEYRLIGFDNKVGALSDTLSSIEGGEVGSGHSMMAVFEIAPTTTNTDDVKNNFTTGNLAEVNLKYHNPGTIQEQHFISKLPFDFTPFGEVGKCYRFSTAVIMFGSILRNSQYTKDISWNDVLSVVQGASPADYYEKEFVTLVEQAKNLYSKQKKKRKEGNR